MTQAFIPLSSCTFSYRTGHQLAAASLHRRGNQQRRCDCRAGGPRSTAGTPPLLGIRCHSLPKRAVAAAIPPRPTTGSQGARRSGGVSRGRVMCPCLRRTIGKAAGDATTSRPWSRGVVDKEGWGRAPLTGAGGGVGQTASTGARDDDGRGGRAVTAAGGWNPRGRGGGQMASGR